MKILLVAGTEPVHEVVEGRLYTLLPGEPLEIEKDNIARAILEMKGESYGIIEVPVIKDRTGIRYDMETAIPLAEAALETAEKRLIAEYVQHQLDDRIRQNFAALPPSPRIATLIEKYHVDLGEYGIRPVGFGSLVPGAQAAAAPEHAELSKLRADNTAQAATISSMQGQMAEILRRLELTGQGQDNSKSSIPTDAPSPKPPVSEEKMAEPQTTGRRR